jgi:hypothetical protein
VQIDKVRGKEEYAIDVIPYSGGRPNSANVFTRKEYAPPAYDEYTYLTAEELGHVQPGMTQYAMPDQVAEISDLFVNKQMMLRNKIIRAIELLCIDSLIAGKITLINGDVIDFHQKAQLQYTTPAVWTLSTADPFGDFGEIGSRMREYGLKELTDAIFGRVALQKFLNNANVQASGDWVKIDRTALTAPVAEDQGAKYHGTFSGVDYKINVWSYPQKVLVPLGFSLPNEGTKVPYVPDDKIICLPESPDLRLYYAANPRLIINDSSELAALTGLPMVPDLARGEMLPYFSVDYDHDSIKIGVKSRPLPVPAGIDEVGIMTVT